MSYNLTNIISNSTGFLSFAVGVNNELMNGMLGVLFLIGLMVIMVMAFVRVSGEIGKSLSAASYITVIISLIFRAAELISSLATFSFVIFCGVVLALSWNK